MGLLERLSEQRLKQITSHATPYLGDDEEIVRWVRARHPEGGREGFVYLTERQLVVHWRGRGRAPGAIALRDIRSWGLDKDSDGGPLLGIEMSEGVVVVQLAVTTQQMAEHVTEFVAHFAELAPEPAKKIDAPEDLGRFVTNGSLQVEGKPRPLSSHARRVGVTIVGGVLVALGGILALPGVPGPGLLVIVGGLAILSREYDWAKDALDWARGKYKKVAGKMRSRRDEPG